MYNKVIQIGNMTADPTQRYTPNGTAICEFRLAVTTKRKDDKETLFIPVTVFGKMGEAVAKYTNKGSKVLVDGRLVEERWTSDGQERTRMKIIAEVVRFLDKKGAGDAPEEHTEKEPF